MGESMMKRSYLFLMLGFSCFFLQSMLSGAVNEWVQNKARKAQQAFQEKINQVQQLTGRLKDVLSSNAQCLLNGTCAPGQREMLLTLAKQIGVAVVALIALATAAIVAAKLAPQQEESLPISSPAGDRVVRIEQIADKYGVTVPRDNSTPAQFIIAIRSRLTDQVKRLSSLVQDMILRVGKELAVQEKALSTVPTTRAVYDQLVTTIDSALAQYNPNNWLFIYAATTGLLQEVKKRLCDSALKPAEAAVQEATEQIQAKAASNVTYREIMNFIHNPQCGR